MGQSSSKKANSQASSSQPHQASSPPPHQDKKCSPRDTKLPLFSYTRHADPFPPTKGVTHHFQVTPSAGTHENEEANAGQNYKSAVESQKPYPWGETMDEQDGVRKTKKKHNNWTAERKHDRSMASLTDEQEKQHAYQISKLHDTIEERDVENVKLREQMDKLKTKIEELTNRLSKVASEKLRDNNPNITDLGDANRPQKISDSFSELYSNEWSDCFMELHDSGMKEKEIIRKLLDTLKMVYRECNLKSEKDMNDFKNQIATFTGEKEFSGNLHSLKAYKDKRKSNYNGFIPEIKQKLTNSVLNKTYHQTVAMQKYIDVAIRLCWLMCIQDPPMSFDFRKGVEFDDNVFKYYTKQSKYIAYVVWPVLYLHEGGPLLSKGIVQGRKNKGPFGQSVGRSSKINDTDQHHSKSQEKPDQVSQFVNSDIQMRNRDRGSDKRPSSTNYPFNRTLDSSRGRPHSTIGFSQHLLEDDEEETRTENSNQPAPQPRPRHSLTKTFNSGMVNDNKDSTGNTTMTGQYDQTIPSRISSKNRDSFLIAQAVSSGMSNSENF